MEAIMGDALSMEWPPATFSASSSLSLQVLRRLLDEPLPRVVLLAHLWPPAIVSRRARSYSEELSRSSRS